MIISPKGLRSALVVPPSIRHLGEAFDPVAQRQSPRHQVISAQSPKLRCSLVMTLESTMSSPVISHHIDGSHTPARRLFYVSCIIFHKKSTPEQQRNVLISAALFEGREHFSKRPKCTFQRLIFLCQPIRLRLNSHVIQIADSTVLKRDAVLPLPAND